MALPYSCRIVVADASSTEVSVRYVNTDGESHAEKITRDALTEATIERLNQWVKEKEAHCDREDLELLGQHLFQFLFPEHGQLRQKFRMDFRRVYDDTGRLRPDARLRIHLIFARVLKDKLTNYPWELLCYDTGRGRVFLSGQRSQLLLSRFVPDADERAAALETRRDKLRVLLVSCAPQEESGGSDEDKVDVQRTKAVLEELQRQNLLEIRTESNVTFEQLRNILAGRERDGTDADSSRPGFDIFHFIGHGSEGAVCLMKSGEEIRVERAASGNSDFRPSVLKSCDGRSFAELFSHHVPRLVFLQACEGAADSIQGLKSVAWTLVYEYEIPGVVAMQYKISNEQALIFARAFYQHLARGRPIDEAVREGREALGQQQIGTHRAWGDRSFATPVTYLCSEKALVDPQIDQPLTNKWLCQNPECSGGFVTRESKFCLRCHEALAECPQCHRPMVVKLHACDCGYSDARAVGANVAAAQSIPRVAGMQGPGSPVETSSGARTPVSDPRLTT